MSKIKSQRRRSAKKDRSIVGHYVYLEYALGLPKRAKWVAKTLAEVKSTFATLYSDEHFITLLRAESMSNVPVDLSPLVPEEKKNWQ